MLPYTSEVLFAQFHTYNEALRPVPVLALLLALAAVYLAARSSQDRSRLILAILAGGWLWTGLVYHFLYFADLNFAAPAYGIVFLLQGAFLCWAGVVRRRVTIAFDGSPGAWVGVGIAVLALAGVPLADSVGGAGWTGVRFALIAPESTALLTLGILTMARGRSRLALTAIPALWTLVAVAHAWVLDIPQDYALPAAALAALLMPRKARRAEEA